MNATIYITDRNSVPFFADKSITDIISIGSDNDFPSLGKIIEGDFNLYRFAFHDVSHEMEGGPAKHHIERLIQLYKNMINDPSDRAILFHCTAGISRSTAAAFIFLVMMGCSYSEAYNGVKESRGYLINPNQLMIRYADELLGHGGKMKEFIDKAHIH